MTEKGAEPNAYTYNALMDGVKRMNAAKRLLSEMSEKNLTPDTVTYSTLMQRSCAKLGDLWKALNLFKEMCSSGLLPDLKAYSILLDGCCKHWTSG
ncbi:hypothetical protein NC651_012082 [Populus alba x Populus x berolinensis]|nr:hypothetical protein NC651_012082 [Populus alba x Populus x berolinensis]